MKIKLYEAIKNNPDLRTELISQMQMDDQAGAEIRFKAALIGACLALKLPLEAQTLAEVTRDSLIFRTQPTVKHAWAGGPSDPNPHRQTLQALQDQSDFLKPMQTIAQHFDGKCQDTAMHALIAAYLLASGFPRHFWVFSEVMTLSFVARYPQPPVRFQGHPAPAQNSAARVLGRA